MPKARKSRPKKCPVCTTRILANTNYLRVVRYVDATKGEQPTPGIGGGRIAEEIHALCETLWRDSLGRRDA